MTEDETLPSDEISSDGVPSDSLSSDGVPSDSLSSDGVPSDSLSSDGVPSGDVSPNGLRGTLLTVIQYGLGLGALAWLLSQVRWTRLGGLLASLDPIVVLVVLVVTICGLVARFYTWRVLVAEVEPMSMPDAGRIDLSVNFINQLFPSRLSGRSAAPVVLRQRTGLSWPDAVAVTGVHTALYALLYGVVALTAAAVAWGKLSAGLLVLVGLSAALYLAAGLAILTAGVHLGVLERVVGAVEAYGSRLPVVGGKVANLAARAPEFADESAAQFARLLSEPRAVLGYAAGWAGVALVAPGLRVYLLFDAFGAPFSPAILVPLYLLLAYSVTLLPLTPGGIGVSEATATLVFVSLGVPKGVVVPVVFLDRLLGVYLPALAGSVPVMRLDLSELVQ